MNYLNDVTLFWLSFWLYLASFLVFTTYLAIRSANLGKIAAGLLFLGFLPHTGGILTRWQLAGQAPLSNMFEYANMMGWLTVAAFAGIVARYRRLILGTIVSPAILMIIVSASMLPKELSAQTMPDLGRHWLAIHVGLTVLAEGAFAVGMAMGVTYLLKSRAEGRNSMGAWHRIPSLTRLDAAGFRAVEFAYPLFTVGALFAGSVWAHEAWGVTWVWEPKQISAIAIWTYYTACFYARLQLGWRGKRFALLNVGGFLLILLSFAVNLVFGGAHAA